jgi:hypothetical protein
MGTEVISIECLATTAVLAVAALATGCQFTSVRSASWDSEFTGPPMRILFVSGDVNWKF